MATVVKKVDYFVTEVPDKPGEAASILATLAVEGVNLLAFTGFPQGRKSQLDFIPEDAAAFKKAAAAIRLRLRGRKTGFLVQGDDKKGAVADILTKLAIAKINVTAIDAVCAGQRRYGAILWVKPAAVRKAAKALRAK